MMVTLKFPRHSELPDRVLDLPRVPVIREHVRTDDGLFVVTKVEHFISSHGGYSAIVTVGVC